MINNSSENPTEIPLCRSVTKTMLLMGAPKLFAVWNIVIAGIFILDLHFYPIVALSIVCHLFARHYAKKDDLFDVCGKNYYSLSKYYCT